MSNESTHVDSHGEHPAFLQHHFDTPLQQYDTAKLGMWAFLAQEILFFSGLFVAYFVFRSWYPEAFSAAAKELNRPMGAFNTVVLLFSSLTAALSVRSAQVGNRKQTSMYLILTILCAFGFLVIKFLEYKAKFDHGIASLPAHVFVLGGTAALIGACLGSTACGAAKDKVWAIIGSTLLAVATFLGPWAVGSLAGTIAPDLADLVGKYKIYSGIVLALGLVGAGLFVKGQRNPARIAMTAVAAVLLVVAGYLFFHADTVGVMLAGAHSHVLEYGAGASPTAIKYGPYFSVYYMLTGVHGLHVAVGIGVLYWVWIRNQRGDFSKAFFTPVDLAALYWHLVDLIWIFLFPLLYLID